MCYLYMHRYLQAQTAKVCVMYIPYLWKDCAHMEVGTRRVSSPAEPVKPPYQPSLCVWFSTDQADIHPVVNSQSRRSLVPGDALISNRRFLWGFILPALPQPVSALQRIMRNSVTLIYSGNLSKFKGSFSGQTRRLQNLFNWTTAVYSGR